MASKLNHHADEEDDEESCEELATDIEEFELIKQELSQAKQNEQKCVQMKHELKDAQLKLKHLQTDKEDLLKELNNLLASKLKLQNECKRYKCDYETIHKEYSQVMSERDLVHKEIEALQEQLCKEKDRIRNFSGTSNEIELLKRELYDACNDRDLALNELKAMYEKKFESFNKSERNSTVYTSNNSLIYEKYFLTKDEKLVQENAKLRQDLKDLQHEVDIANKRRDWAFGERDKMIKERESIRGLCDELRHQRDKSISELAEALRESDELKKNKSNAIKQISLLEEQIRELEERLVSREKSENTKMLQIEVIIEESDELGVEFKIYEEDGDNDFSPEYLVVDYVPTNSPAYGRLKESDRVYRIRNVDIKELNMKSIQDFLANLCGNVKFIVSRDFCSSSSSAHLSQKHLSQMSVNERLISIHKNTMSDLMIETGAYVSALKPNSEANDCLDIGDRLISVNGHKLVNKTYMEIVELIKEQESEYDLIVLKSSLRNEQRQQVPSTNNDEASSSSSSIHVQSIDSIRLTPKNWIKDSLASKLNGTQSSINDEELPKKRPFVGEIRVINIEKQANEVLGINICEKENQHGVVISQVVRDSLAERAGIHEGDQILEICGVNLRTAGYKEAAKVLMDCSCSNEFISLILQYNPKHLSNSHLNTISLKVKICLLKQLSVEIIGGNHTGIFVSRLSSDTSLQVGDQICEINGVSLRHVTLEKAFYELFVNEASLVEPRLIIQTNPVLFEKLIKFPTEPDSFYMVSLVDRRAKNESELGLHKLDVLQVTNTLPNGKVDSLWKVRVIHSQHEKVPRIGLIPSFKRIFDELRESKSPQSISNSSLNTPTSRNGRFFTNFLRQTSSKSLESTQTVVDYHVDLSPNQHDSYFDPYELVECIDSSVKRPCIIIGPLNLFICRQIEIDNAEEYHFFERDLIQFSKLNENFIDLVPRQSTGQYDCIDVIKLQDLACNQRVHAFLKLENLNEIECLKRMRLHPIVIILNYKSPKHLIHLNSLCSPTHSSTNKLDAKLAKDLIKYTSDIERKFKSYVSTCVEISSNDIKSMCDLIKEHITKEQSKKLWIPAWSPHLSKDILLS